MRFKRIVLTDYVFKIALGFAYDDVSMLFEILWGVTWDFGWSFAGQFGRRLNDQDYYSVLPESRFKMAWGDMG